MFCYKLNLDHKLLKAQLYLMLHLGKYRACSSCSIIKNGICRLKEGTKEGNLRSFHHRLLIQICKALLLLLKQGNLSSENEETCSRIQSSRDLIPELWGNSIGTATLLGIGSSVLEAHERSFWFHFFIN